MASWTPYWRMGLSTMGSICFGCALVAGRNRVPSPAAGKTALRTLDGINSSLVHRRAVGNCGIVFPRPLVLCIGTWEKTPMAYVIAEPVSYTHLTLPTI